MQKPFFSSNFDLFIQQHVISRFWYGGDEGNENKFDDKKLCDETCVDPIGREACELPRVTGPCDGHFPR